MFHQLLTPVAGDLALSCLVAALPVAVVLLMLGVARTPAWMASLGGLVVGGALAALVWKLPAPTVADSAAAGAVFALWPIMWIVFNALVLYNLTVASGRFEAFAEWVTTRLPDDRRVVLVVIGFCFGALLEGVSGFGTPVAITSALLMALGFPALEAVVFTLIFNTAPVAFGALGAPVTTLAAVTQLPSGALAGMIGRQLPFVAVILPFYVVAIYGGIRSVKRLWPVLLVAGASFALTQFLVSNFLDFALTDILAPLASLVLTLGFLAVWRPAPDPQYACARLPRPAGSRLSPASGWVPWITVTAVVLVWTFLKVSRFGDVKVQWPGLHDAVFITLYAKPYAAVWDFQPLATGTAILVATVIVAGLCRSGVADFASAVRKSWIQARLPIVTVMMIVGLAYVMNYSGMTYTLGRGVAAAGPAFPMLSVFLGWLAVFLSGSDTSGNALFGNLQVAAAHQLGLNPIVTAATNSSGGVLGKMISPQNISTGCSVTELNGREGAVLARTFWHSLVLTVLLGVLAVLQQHALAWMVPR